MRLLPFHRTFELHDCIRDLAGIIQPDFTVIDGILSMEGDGPLDTGTPRKNTNLIIASRDMVAADNVGAMLMGYDVDEVAHMPKAKGFTRASVPSCRPPVPASCPARAGERADVGRRACGAVAHPLA